MVNGNASSRVFNLEQIIIMLYAWINPYTIKYLKLYKTFTDYNFIPKPTINIMIIITKPNQAAQNDYNFKTYNKHHDYNLIRQQKCTIRIG